MWVNANTGETCWMEPEIPWHANFPNAGIFRSADADSGIADDAMDAAQSMLSNLQLDRFGPLGTGMPHMANEPQGELRYLDPLDLFMPGALTGMQLNEQVGMGPSPYILSYDAAAFEKYPLGIAGCLGYDRSSPYELAANETPIIVGDSCECPRALSVKGYGARNFCVLRGGTSADGDVMIGADNARQVQLLQYNLLRIRRERGERYRLFCCTIGLGRAGNGHDVDLDAQVDGNVPSRALESAAAESSVYFTIIGDGKVLYRSTAFRTSGKGEIASIVCNVESVSTLLLCVECGTVDASSGQAFGGGGVFGVWCDPHLICEPVPQSLLSWAEKHEGDAHVQDREDVASRGFSAHIESRAIDMCMPAIRTLRIEPPAVGGDVSNDRVPEVKTARYRITVVVSHRETTVPTADVSVRLHGCVRRGEQAAIAEVYAVTAWAPLARAEARANSASSLQRLDTGSVVTYTVDLRDVGAEVHRLDVSHPSNRAAWAFDYARIERVGSSRAPPIYFLNNVAPVGHPHPAALSLPIEMDARLDFSYLVTVHAGTALGATPDVLDSSLSIEVLDAARVAGNPDGRGVTFHLSTQALNQANRLHRRRSFVVKSAHNIMEWCSACSVSLERDDAVLSVDAIEIRPFADLENRNIKLPNAKSLAGKTFFFGTTLRGKTPVLQKCERASQGIYRVVLRTMDASSITPLNTDFVLTVRDVFGDSFQFVPAGDVKTLAPMPSPPGKMPTIPASLSSNPSMVPSSRSKALDFDTSEVVGYVVPMRNGAKSDGSVSNEREPLLPNTPGALNSLEVTVYPGGLARNNRYLAAHETDLYRLNVEVLVTSMQTGKTVCFGPDAERGLSTSANGQPLFALNRLGESLPNASILAYMHTLNPGAAPHDSVEALEMHDTDSNDSYICLDVEREVHQCHQYGGLAPEAMALDARYVAHVQASQDRASSGALRQYRLIVQTLESTGRVPTGVDDVMAFPTAIVHGSNGSHRVVIKPNSAADSTQRQLFVSSGTDAVDFTCEDLGEILRVHLRAPEQATVSPLPAKRRGVASLFGFGGGRAASASSSNTVQPANAVDDMPWVWTPKRVSVRNITAKRTRVFPYPRLRPLDCVSRSVVSDSRWLMPRGVHGVALPFPGILGESTGFRLPYKLVVRHDDPGASSGWALDSVELAVSAKRGDSPIHTFEAAMFPAEHLADPIARTGSFDNPFSESMRRYARPLYSVEETRRLLKMHARTNTVQTASAPEPTEQRGVDRIASAIKELKRLFRDEARSQELWNQIDVNGDGQLDVDEQLALVRLALPGADASIASAVVALLDTDGDGYVTQDELLESLGAAKQRMAISKERGKRSTAPEGIDPDVRSALQKAIADGALDRAAFAAASRGGDGLCRVHEVATMLKSLNFKDSVDSVVGNLVELGDADGDGLLSFDELEKLLVAAPR